MSGPPRILLVEDQNLIALGLTELLNETGHQAVGVAATVSDALSVAATTKPDVAVVDVRLGGRRDGIEGAQLLREQFRVAVVFLTAQADPETKDRAAAVNPVGFLRKPVHPERLVQAIQTSVQKKRPLGTNRAD